MRKAHTVLIGFVLLAVLLGSRGRAQADEEADLRAANAEGIALYQKGEYPRAAPAFEQALELAPRVFGAEHQNTASIMNNLACTYYFMGQYAKAEPLHQRSLKIRELTLGLDHPEVAQSLNVLANLYRDMGQYAKAEPL